MSYNSPSDCFIVILNSSNLRLSLGLFLWVSIKDTCVHCLNETIESYTIIFKPRNVHTFSVKLSECVHVKSVSQSGH